MRHTASVLGICLLMYLRHSKLSVNAPPHLALPCDRNPGVQQLPMNTLEQPLFNLFNFSNLLWKYTCL